MPRLAVAIALDCAVVHWRRRGGGVIAIIKLSSGGNSRNKYGKKLKLKMQNTHINV